LQMTQDAYSKVALAEPYTYLMYTRKYTNCTIGL
jgi:hypothetical protein